MSEMQFDYYRSKPDGSNEHRLHEDILQAVFGLEWPKIKNRMNGPDAEKFTHDGWAYWSEEAMRYA